MIAGPVNDVPGPVSLDLSDVDLDNDEDILITNRMGVVYLVVSEDADGIATWRRSRTSSIPPAGPSGARD